MLGVDFGTVRTGVAISNSDRSVATPLDVIETSDLGGLAEHLARLVEEWQCSLVVIGEPASLRGHDGTLSARVQELSDLLSRGGIRVTTFDERLTSHIANAALAEMNVASKDRKQKVDKIAASVILQSYLDTRRATGPADASDVTDE